MARPETHGLPSYSATTLVDERQYSYARYLRSKRTVDDRALNRAVMDTAVGALDTSRCLEVAELGGGVGTMVDRLMADGRISSANYVLVRAGAE